MASSSWKPRTNLLTVTEASERLRCSTQTRRRRVRDGSLAAHKVGGRLLFDPSEIRRFLHAMQVLPR